MNRMRLNSLIQKSPYLQSLTQPKVILSTLAFQLVWWQLLVFVTQDLAFLGCAISLLYVLFHLRFIAKDRWSEELRFIVIFGVLGWLGDLVLVLLQIQKFQTTPLVPFWLLCLWLNYMTSIHYSMSQLFRNPALTLFVGFLFGPWTYLACWKLNLMEFPRSVAVACAVQGVLWMLWLWFYRLRLLKSQTF